MVLYEEALVVRVQYRPSVMSLGFLERSKGSPAMRKTQEHGKDTELRSMAVIYGERWIPRTRLEAEMTPTSMNTFEARSVRFPPSPRVLTCKREHLWRCA
jgi:hypothetical protein